MPFADWQFYVVTLAALLAVGALVRALWPSKRRDRTKRTKLTIEGKRHDA